jgi:hypothetical protein
MRSWSRKALLWQGVGILCYLAGLLVFVSVVIGVFLAPPQNSLANLSSGHVPILIASVALIVAGRLISYKYGVQNGLSGAVREYHGRPEKSKLEELGYVIPPENEGSEGGLERKLSLEEGELTVACNECGAENDPDYRFCGNCSAELPD